MISDAQLLAHTRAESSETAYLRTLEKAAIKSIQNRTGRYYGPITEITETLHWRGWPMSLSSDPLDGEISALESWDGSAWGAVATDTYFLSGKFLYWNSRTIPAWSPLTMPTRYQVTYDAGYEVNEDDENVWAAPEDIQHAVLLLVGHWYENREAVVVGDSSSGELPLAVSSLIDPHIRVAV